MGKEILFFLAGWFSVAIGFEVAPMYGNIAGVVSFVALHIWFSRPTKRAPDACPYCAGKGEFVNVIGKALRCNHCAGTGQRR